MRKPTALDWIGATIIWGISSVVVGVFLSEGVGFDEEVGVTVCLGMFMAGIVAARLWVLRRPENAPVGLTTGEAQVSRLEDVEMRLAEMETLQERVAELEERLDFSERLLVSGGQRLPVDRSDG